MTTDTLSTATLAVACAFEPEILELADNLKSADVSEWEPEARPLTAQVSKLATSLNIQDKECVQRCVGGLLHRSKRPWWHRASVNGLR